MITQSEAGPLAVRWDPRAVGSAMIWVAVAYLILLAGVVALVGAASPPAQFGVWRWAGILLLGSGATSVLAFAFLGAGWETVHFISTLTSAALTVPLAVVAMVIGQTLRRAAARR